MTEQKKVDRAGAGTAETSHIAADPAPARRRRLTAARKQEAVLRVLRGEDVELVARSLDATAADVSGWRDAFLEAGAAGLTIHHDNGSQDISHDFQNEIAWLGAATSPSFVRAPEGNGCAERFIRTLKENLLWVTTFETIEKLQQALQKFKNDYNEHWLSIGIQK